jgi:hypothetical protein
VHRSIYCKQWIAQAECGEPNSEGVYANRPHEVGPDDPAGAARHSRLQQIISQQHNIRALARDAGVAVAINADAALGC